MRIVVVGAGAWGTALAVCAANNTTKHHEITLWARDPIQVDEMRACHENRRYLPGIGLPRTLVLSSVDLSGLGNLIAEADLVLLATPISALRHMLSALRAHQVPMAWLCKGIERPEPGARYGLLPHEVQAQVAPNVTAGVLGGPSFALEVARGWPTALVASSTHETVCQALVRAFHTPTLRVYVNNDLVGVEVGGAVKNVLAIATGLCDGLGLGMNARAALITRGLTEMARFGMALGARAETFMGLSGLGDLVLTSTGDLSRNRQVGLALARGQTLQQTMNTLGHVAEGVGTARSVSERAVQLGMDMPITQAIVALLDGSITPTEAVAQLMEREPTTELAVNLPTPVDDPTG